MTKDFSRIRKMLTMSTTMPLGTGGGMPLMGSAHVHSADGSCCGHDHHDHHHHHDHGHHHHHHDGGCCDHDHEDEDTTNPRGGCC